MLPVFLTSRYSQRRACHLVGLHPKTYRYVTKRSGDEELRQGLRELALQRSGLAIVAPGQLEQVPSFES